MKDRLIWLLYQLNKLNGDGYIRYEGNPLFQGAKMELDSILSTFDADQAALLAAAAPTVVQQVVMTADQVADVIGSIPKVGNYESVMAGLSAVVHDAIELSDVAVMAAINDKGNEVLAALAPAA